MSGLTGTPGGGVARPTMPPVVGGGNPGTGVIPGGVVPAGGVPGGGVIPGGLPVQRPTPTVRPAVPPVVPGGRGGPLPPPPSQLIPGQTWPGWPQGPAVQPGMVPARPAPLPRPKR
jgi:hypothetical protein